MKIRDIIRQLACSICHFLGGKDESTPKLKPAGTIDIHRMSSILLDKLEEMGDTHAELYLADVACKVYKKDDMVKWLSLDETDEITYIAEKMDCDDFAAELYGKGIPLLWSNVHALNFFISEDEKLYFVEPQTDKISQTLENWQGWDCRFFLSR
uniref:Agglutinin C-terminal domain-containing protein n=1 Tax=viral metagenome TaxID=1070528 RepID=A0A6H2A1Y7_9ZZZZ